MADLGSPFGAPQPAQVQPPTASPPDQQNGLAEQWKGWINAPENRAALMQFGLAMMQPVGLGQTPVGAFGQAAGAGMEARDRSITEQEAKATQAEETALKRRQVGAGELTAEASMIRAQREPTASYVTPYQQASLRQTQIANYTRWVGKRTGDILPGQPQPTPEQLRAEYLRLGGELPDMGTSGRTTPQGSPYPDYPNAQQGSDGQWYAQDANGKWGTLSQ